MIVGATVVKFLRCSYWDSTSQKIAHTSEGEICLVNLDLNISLTLDPYPNKLDTTLGADRQWLLFYQSTFVPTRCCEEE